MSDEQLDETSISQGHGTFGICDWMCMLMCASAKNLILKYQIWISVYRYLSRWLWWRERRKTDLLQQWYISTVTF